MPRESKAARLRPGIEGVQRTHKIARRRRRALRELGEARNRKPVVVGIQLDAKIATPTERGGETGAPGTCEKIQNQVSRSRKTLDERPQNAHGFLRGMNAIAAVLPRPHIAQR